MKKRYVSILWGTKCTRFYRGKQLKKAYDFLITGQKKFKVSGARKAA